MRLSFGATIPRYDQSYEAVERYALEVEGLGLDSIWVTDHLQPRRGRTVLESWTLLSALATRVKRPRLGTTVLCYSYRHPALLAKMAATLDQISGGRLELGVGTGSEPQAEEHNALGIPHPAASQRRRQLVEYVEVLRLLMAKRGEARYSGKYYTLAGAVCNTPSVQSPFPPIWVGARRRRMLEVVAAVGEGWNFYGESVEEFERAHAELESICSNLGKDSSRLRKAVFSSIIAFRDAEEKKMRLGSIGGATSEEELYRKTLTMIHGTPDECIAQIERLSRLGVSLLILRDLEPGMPSLRLAASHVLTSFW